MVEPIPLSEDRLEALIDSGQMGHAKAVRRAFEKDLAEFLSHRHNLAVSEGVVRLLARRAAYSIVSATPETRADTYRSALMQLPHLLSEGLSRLRKQDQRSQYQEQQQQQLQQQQQQQYQQQQQQQQQEWYSVTLPLFKLLTTNSKARIEPFCHYDTNGEAG